MHPCVWRSYLDDLAHGHPLRQMAPPRGQRGLEFDAVGEQWWHRDAIFEQDRPVSTAADRTSTLAFNIPPRT